MTRRLHAATVFLAAIAAIGTAARGRQVERADLKLEAGICCDAKPMGRFAGLSIEGARLAADNKSNVRYHGQPDSVERILLEQGPPGIPGRRRGSARRGRRSGEVLYSGQRVLPSRALGEQEGLGSAREGTDSRKERGE